VVVVVVSGSVGWFCGLTSPVSCSIERLTGSAAKTMVRCASIESLVRWWMGRARRSLLPIRKRSRSRSRGLVAGTDHELCGDRVPSGQTCRLDSFAHLAGQMQLLLASVSLLNGIADKSLLAAHPCRPGHRPTGFA
jgi:hypothetical protein